MSIRKIKIGMLLCLLTLVFAGCGVGKHIPSGTYLLKKNEIKIIDDFTKKKESNITKKEIDNLIIQDPNTKVLGIGKLSMRFYCLSNPKSKSWLNKLIRNMGQKPVIYDPSLSFQTSEKVQLYLENKGSFTSIVEVKPSFKRKKATILYEVHPSKPYKIRKVEYLAEDDTIQKILDKWKTNSTIKLGDHYDLDNLSEDRNKIAIALQNNGYFGFYKENIVFEVDTNFNNLQLDITLKVLNPRTYILEKDSSIYGTHKQYHIKNVFVLPQFGVDNDSIKKDTTIVQLYRRRDTLQMNYIFLHNGKIPVNPKTIAQNLFIDPSNKYTLTAGDRTYTGLSNLNNFRYLNIGYTENTEDTDSIPQLDAWIRLTEMKRNSISSSFDLTNTSSGNSADKNVGNFGLEWSFGYQNRNLLGNAEILNIKYRLFVQLPKDLTTTESKKFLSYFSTFETGININLDIPKFLFPVRKDFISRYRRPRTSFNISYGYQYRPYYERSIPGVGFGYKWRQSSRIEHSLFPFEFNAIKILIKDSVFRDSINHLSDRALKYQYTDHLIMDARYSYLLTTQRPGLATNFSSLLMSIESGGNLFYAINTINKSKRRDDGVYEMFGIPYAQYIRTDFDMKRYFYFTRKTVLVFRGYLGLGFPYGNSQAMPFEKSFYGGGPNGVRAWQMRTLGPGAFQNTTNTLFDRIGDISICGNIEQRFQIFSVFEGATFIDVGNIWLQRESKEFTGGIFEFNTFYKELAIGGGFGLRINFSVAVIRLDFALPFRDPSRDFGERWRITKLKVSDLVVNFGIGYPF